MNDDTAPALTARQQVFVAAYLDCLNATEAARRAKYKNPRASGAENLAKPGIRDAITAGLRAQTMPKDEVLARLNAQARGDMSEFLRVDEEEITLTWSLIQPRQNLDGTVQIGELTMELAAQEQVRPTDLVLQTATVKRAVARLDLLEAGRNGKLGLIKKYSIDPGGKIAIELYDAQAALIKLGEAYGVFRDRIADNLDALTAAAQSLEQKLLADLESGSASGVAAPPDDGGEGPPAL